MVLFYFIFVATIVPACKVHGVLVPWFVYCEAIATTVGIPVGHAHYCVTSTGDEHWGQQ